jgi:ribonucleoside-diphosphate reductase alpha chain
MPTLADLPVGTWTEAALRAMQKRYLLKHEGKVVESPEEMCLRVATAVSEAERHFGKNDEQVDRLIRAFAEVMIERKFFPNSPTLMNAGKGTGLQYSACYVLPVEDSLDKIFESVKNAALIHQSGGGTGFSFSRLRPKDSPVRRSGGIASGPVSFLRVFDGATEAVKQGGTRRGANMGILRVDHPDILEFIDSKLTGGIANFNISVAATDAFMQAVVDDAEYDIINPYSGGPQEKPARPEMRAREVFDRIVHAAWQTGDPGVIFLDRINNSPSNPVPSRGPVEATNPCGEQPLYPNEACNLGSINMAALVRRLNGTRELDLTELERVVRLAVRFLDDVIEVNPYPLPEIDEMVKKNRRIGLGVMGWADLLFLLDMPYDSQEALDLAESVMRRINEVGHDESAALARERGPFPTFPESIYADGPPLRNSTVTTIAPTGSISIIAGCSSGIEPVFALAYRHTFLDAPVATPVFEQIAREEGFLNDDLLKAVMETGSVRDVDQVPEKWQRVFVTAHEIAPEWHVRMQAAFQKHTDNGVSKTINLPDSATVEDVRQAYLLAYQLGCKGITVFRDGCKGSQVLVRGVHQASQEAPVLEAVAARPDRLKGTTYRKETALGRVFVTINRDENNEPLELFLTSGKTGSDVTAFVEATGRLISLLLRIESAVPRIERAQLIIDQLKGIGGREPHGFGPKRILSIPDAVAKALEEDIANPERQDSAEPRRHNRNSARADICPQCGQATLVHEEGCNKCYECGYSNC